MVKKRVVALTGLSVFLLIALVGFASALDINATLVGNSRVFLDLATNNTINISITAMGENITKVILTYQTDISQNDPDNFMAETNGTSATNLSFFNSSITVINTKTVNLTFKNTSTSGFINNQSEKFFWIDLGARRRYFSGAFLTLTVNVTYISGETNQTTFSFQPAFAFAGTILNETGCATCYQNYTNVTIYGVIQGFNGPPTNDELASALTNASGYFRLNRINMSSTYNGYKLKMIYYNDSGTATKVGSNMPEFPAMMFYGGDAGAGVGEERPMDMSLNGASFYLQPAATINLTANNGTDAVSFGYELIDQALGFPIESNVQGKVYNATIVVPAGRSYTVSMYRMFGFPGGQGYVNNYAACGGTDFMNDTDCPTPPKSNRIGLVNSTQVVRADINLSVRKANVEGCINIASGANNTLVNITNVQIKMMPWEGFVPPRSGDDGSINISAVAQMNYTIDNCFAYYNFSLLSDTGYFLEFYAKNASTEDQSPGSANNLVGFANFTSSDGLQVNATMYKLAGSYQTTGTTGLGVNTSVVRINIQNSTGGPMTTGLNANVKIKNNVAGIGTIYYITDTSTFTNGTFYMPILNNSNYAKVMVFSQNGPPKEGSINLSAGELNITVRSMGNEDKGFRKMNASGQLEVMNSSNIPIRMRFLRTDAGCDIPNAPDSCVLTSMDADGFNPLKALLAGKVHMEIKITSTNVSLIFRDYDMMSAKQPPMDSMMEENASGRSSSSGRVQEQWNFGSFAPADSYANVSIIMPYADGTSASNYLNDSAPVNVSVPILYNENQQAIWNVSRGFGAENLTEEFMEYNNSFYRNMLRSGGINCNATSLDNVCAINTSQNYIKMEIPHFSSIGAAVIGSGVASTDSGSGTTTSSGGGGGGGSASGWTSTYTYDSKDLKEQPVLEREMSVMNRVRVNISGDTHHVGVVAMDNFTATINVTSDPKQVILRIGESAKFELTSDNRYDLLVGLKSINSGKANVTISSIDEEIPAGTNASEPKIVKTGEDSGNLGGDEEKAGIGAFGKTILILIIVLVLVILVWAGVRIATHNRR